MTYLCINNINDISLSNIFIKDRETIYKIYYNMNGSTIYGITLKCNGKLLESKDKYKFIIYNGDTKTNLKLIDRIFFKKIDNYNSFLKQSDYTYIEFPKNIIVDNLLRKYKDKDNIYLNIKFINKYTNTPIVYII